MSNRRPRRQRRRPRERASTLPRPVADGAERPAPVAVAASAPPRPVARERIEHHVAADYRYVRRDLAVVGVVSAITLAFVLVAAFLA